jgi:hypothetical protein
MSTSKHKPHGSNFGSLSRPPVGAIAPKPRTKVMIGMYVTPAERAAITQAAMLDGCDVSGWIREMVLKRVRELST